MPIALVTPEENAPAAAAAGSAWRERLRPASFRGAPFFVGGADIDTGRRTVIHEYPQRDLPYVEDLGRKTRIFSVEGFVVGSDYLDRYQVVLDAVEQPGLGRLVHPSLGEMTVAVTTFKGRENFATEGGLARFSFTFTESGEAAWPAVETDTRAAVGQAADGVGEAARADFARTWAPGGLKAVFAAAIADLRAWLSVFDDVAGMLDLSMVTEALDAVLALPGMLRSALPGMSLLSQIATIRRQVGELMDLPDALASSFSGLISGFSGLFGTGGGSLGGFGLVGAGASGSAGTLAGGTPLLAIADAAQPGSAAVAWAKVPPAAAVAPAVAANQQVLAALIRRECLCQAARVAAATRFTTAGEAQAVRDDLGRRLDAEILAAADYAVQAALAALRAAMVTDLTRRAANLPVLVAVTLPVTLPALAIAARLYDDAGRADDLVTRNRVRNPMFVPPGSLTVVCDGRQ